MPGRSAPPGWVSVPDTVAVPAADVPGVAEVADSPDVTVRAEACDAGAAASINTRPGAITDTGRRSAATMRRMLMLSQNTTRPTTLRRQASRRERPPRASAGSDRT